MGLAPQRILIVRLSHLGDVAQTLPLYHALRAAHPTARIAWAVQPEFAGLVEPLPGLERAIRFDRRDGARGWSRLARELEQFGADWTIDAQGNVKSALVALASRAPRRSGYARADWREPFGATSTTEACAPGPSSEHAVDRLLRLARHVAPGWDGVPRFDAALSPAELARGERALAALTHGAGGVLIHLSNPADVRAWPLARWAEAARLAAEQGPVVIVSGPAEELHGRALERELRDPRVAHLVGQRGLRELAALFTAAARRGMAFAGCDSGPLHLAWASGLRVVLLAGPQDEFRTGPYPPRGPHTILRAEPPPACAPCRARRCEHAEGPVCLSAIAGRELDAALRTRARGRSAG
ncbi:MAG: glycosyltransferase family 9 protein [Planctomycetes bacterium]|nr:glycosyltransferase family 9 protein [Planctomycetota bacterium]